MKKRLINKIAFCITFLMLTESSYGQISQLYELDYKKDFPALNQLLIEGKHNIPARTQTIFRASILNAYGKTKESDQLLNKIALNTTTLSPADTLSFIGLKTRYDNSVKMLDYKNAALTGNLLLSKYKAFFSDDSYEEESEAVKIWRLLVNVPGQRLVKSDDSKITLKKDRGGLLNIPVKAGNETHDFVFDSGAGMSVITESYAKKLNFKPISDSTISIESGITGLATPVKLALAEHLAIGNITISNSVFLVFPDSALSFGGGIYKINGIIGFPVIKEFEALTFTDRTDLYIPKKIKSSNTKPNMILDGLKPAIYLSYNQVTLPFTFDTGGSKSKINNNFYSLFRTRIEATGKPTEQEIGGTGGTLVFKGVEMPELTLMSGSTPIVLKNVFVSKEVISTNGEIYYGNIGQDAIKQFRKMTINFKDSYILFENRL